MSTHADPSRTPRRSLVTGGAGFIGSHVTEHLLGLGREVVVVDDLSTGRRSNLPDSAPGLTVHECDLAAVVDQIGDGRPMGAFDEVYHLAAAVGVKLVMERPAEAIETNVSLTAELLRAVLTAGPDGSPARTLIASSSEVYGRGVGEVFSEEDDVIYGPTTVTRWSYAASKALDEHLALAHHRQAGLPAVIVRFFNTVGPRQLGEYGMVLPRFVRAALADEPITVHGDGTQSRCFCDVRDVVRVLPDLLCRESCFGHVYNIGSDHAVSIGELARTVIDVLGSRSRVELVPYEADYPSGFEDLKRRRPDLTRIREAVGFEPRVPLEKTIRDIAAELAAEVAR